MNRNRGEMTQPRARYDVPSRGRANPPIPGTTSGDRPVAIPRHVESAGQNVTMAWVMGHSGVDVMQGEVDDEAFRQVVATRAEARELLQSGTYEVLFGPPQGYRGGTLLSELPDGHEAVVAACTMVRCITYEAQLQALAPVLQREIAAAQQAASEAAYEAVAADWERYLKQVDELANNPRTGGTTSAAIRPPRVEPDLTEVRKAQARLDRLGSEIHAVRRRKDTANRIVSETLQRLADAAVRLLWIGPDSGSVPERSDWSEMYTAYDVLLELTGKDKADEMMDKAVKRWGRRQ